MMAYYSSNYYDVPYGYGYYDSAPIQASIAFSSYSNYNDEHKFFDYDSTPYYHYNSYYDSAPSPSTVSYSVSTSTVPKFLQYNPEADDHHNSSLTQFVVSYSTSEFNEPEFEEYDTTPYGGGYDLVATYGKPLPPSDEICYPRSTSNPTNASSHGSIPSPQKEEFKEPAAKQETTEPATKSLIEEAKKEEPLEPEPKQGEPTQESTYGDGNGNGCGYYYPWAWDGYEYDKQVPVPQTQCGSEGVDLCESIFGYWPCFSHGDRYGGQEAAHGGSCRRSQNWNGSADYIFGGSSYPYGQGREHGGNYPNPIFGYQIHYQEQSLHRQVEYEEASLLNITTNYL